MLAAQTDRDDLSRSRDHADPRRGLRCRLERAVYSPGKAALGPEAPAARERLARRILSQAQRGIRDPIELSSDGVAHVLLATARSRDADLRRAGAEPDRAAPSCRRNVSSADLDARESAGRSAPQSSADLTISPELVGAKIAEYEI